MAKTPCELWFELFYDNSPYTNQLFNEFLTRKQELIDHLNKCELCKNQFIIFSPKKELIPTRYMNDQRFSEVIRKLWKFVRQKNKTP